MTVETFEVFPQTGRLGAFRQLVDEDAGEGMGAVVVELALGQGDGFGQVMGVAVRRRNHRNQIGGQAAGHFGVEQGCDLQIGAGDQPLDDHHVAAGPDLLDQADDIFEQGRKLALADFLFGLGEGDRLDAFDVTEGFGEIGR